jgi:two-component system phosphate regulon sensor histidine kinase PhoR
MNKKSYKWVVYFISITVIITIAVQVYWNYKEYQINKQNLISKVQLSLDNSVEAYFANLTKTGIITLTSQNGENSNEKTDTIVVSSNTRLDLRKQIDSTIENLANFEKNKPLLIESSKNDAHPFFFFKTDEVPKHLDSLISKVVIALSKDTLDLKKLDSYLIKEFERNHLGVVYGLRYIYFHSVFEDSIIEKTIDYKLENFPKNHLKTLSKSTFLPHRSNLELLFTNETAILLRSSLISILLSLLLSGSIIASLLYLLKTIYKQKQLAEVKNDLINNITHEFKTPIATISTALEAMKSFNALDDKVKSEKYISMANSQVHKLNEMVEKILETASLNNEELVLQKERVHLNKLIENVLEKYRFINIEKTLIFKSSNKNIKLNLDTFHFENALGNIIDNAIKYGGNTINVDLTTTNKNIVILIKDDGIGIHKAQREKVFEQFYRIPTGNTHNIKGFGIGLYYTKKIIEKHRGSIDIIYDKNNNTLFKIELLNE